MKKNIKLSQISDMFNISVELNCHKKIFMIFFNSEFFKISFDEKSKKHFLKLINKRIDTIFSRKSNECNRQIEYQFQWVK